MKAVGYIFLTIVFCGLSFVVGKEVALATGHNPVDKQIVDFVFANCKVTTESIDKFNNQRVSALQCDETTKEGAPRTRIRNSAPAH